jgi:uncharacterized membrane protein
MRLSSQALGRAWRIALAPTTLAAIFFTQICLAVILLAVLVPPCENPDEFNHMNRADQVAGGGLIATRYGGEMTSGGEVDLGVNRIDAMIGVIRFHPERKATLAMLQQAHAVRWGDTGQLTFANTSIYAPFLYLPAVVGIWAGKAADLSVVHTMMLARAANGLSCALIGGLAIALSAESAFLLFIVLSLPMCVFQYAAVSQDGLMFVLSAGIVAGLAKLQSDTAPSRRAAFVAMCLCLALLGMGRPAYAPLAVLGLVAPGISWRCRLAGSAAVLLAIAAWSLLAGALTMINALAPMGVSPGPQLYRLLGHPGLVWPLARHAVTDHQGMEGLSFFKEFVGVLGWQDVILPS